MKIENKFKVVYTNEAYYKMYAYARAAKGEVTGFGTVKTIGNTLLVDDLYIVPQRATAAGVHVTGDTLTEFMGWCKREKRMDRVSGMRLWWHSHADFGCFRSGTDKATCELLLQVMPWLLCVVVNKKGQHETTIHLKDPARVTFTRPKVEVEHAPYQEWNDQCTAEVAAMVKEWAHDPKPEPKPPVKVYHTTPHDYHPIVPTAIGEFHQGHLLEVGEEPLFRQENNFYPKRDLTKIPFHAMTNEEFEWYCNQHDIEKVRDEEEKKGDTKRFIVSEGELRAESGI